MVGHIAAGADSSQAGGGAQTKPQAIDPDNCKCTSCDSAMLLLSGGPPVPHPSLYDRQSSPQQMSDSGTLLGTPRLHWAECKQYIPALEETCVMLNHICPSQCPSLPTMSSTRHLPSSCVCRWEGCPYVKGWTTHADSSSLRNPPPDAHAPTDRDCPSSTCLHSGLQESLPSPYSCRPFLFNSLTRSGAPMTFSFPHCLQVSSLPFLTDSLSILPQGQSFSNPRSSPLSQ